MQYLLFLFFCLVFSCQPQYTGWEVPQGLVDRNYSSPEKIYLTSSLEEISGLSINAKDELVAVNDEQGRAYFLDKENGQILYTLKFGSGGDYEGVEVVGETIYVVSSKGDIHSVTGQQELNVIVKTHLNSNNNVEGLGYNPSTHTLLLACKDKAVADKKNRGKRAIYSYNIANGKLSTAPTFTFDQDALREQFGKEKLQFKPSGIAKSPIADEYYITSAVGNYLLITDLEGNALELIKFSTALFSQPEAICFDAENNLYVASEGKDQRPSMAIFKWQGAN